jgi:hypothetical protein
MKIIKFLLIIPIILVAVIYYSCDDSGVLPSDVPRGRIVLTQKNLKHIDPNIDGVYELWLRIDSLGSVINYSLGRFNINTSGNITDTSGGYIEFKFQGDTNSLGFSTDAFITVEPPGDFNGQPSSSVLLSGQTAIILDSLYTTMKLSGGLALGSAGVELLSGHHAKYMLSTPTSTAANCLRGVWFCDTLENTGFPSGLQMTSSGWVYEGWIMDRSISSSLIYFSMGRFTNPYGPDFDGAGSCAGTGTPYSKPGQDWVQDNCPSGLPPILNLSNGSYEVFVTIEPSYETSADPGYYKPFMQVYRQNIISSTLGCWRIDNLFSLYVIQPQARLRISY